MRHRSSSLVLLGAGASLGGRVAPQTPPLTDRLFEALIDDPTCDGWRAISADWGTRFAEDFERATEEYYDHVQGRSQELGQLASELARFFSRFATVRGHALHALAELAKRSTRRVVFTTLNYDLLLEQALESLGVEYEDRIQWASRTTYGDEDTGEISRERCSVLKPHGGANYFVTQGLLLRQNAVRGMGSGDGPVTRVAPASLLHYHRQPAHELGLPVLSLFEPQKEPVVGGLTLEAIRRAYAEEVRVARDVLVIGARIREHDEHIWGPLAGTDARLTYLNPSETDVEAFSAWVAANGRSHDRTIAQKFTVDCRLFQDVFPR